MKILYFVLLNIFVFSRFIKGEKLFMRKKYGKLKNGKLIIASDIILRNEELFFSDEELFRKNNYKEIVYIDPPQNKEGYTLKSHWTEHSQKIIQEWEYEKIPDDHSGELLVAVRNFDEGIIEIRKAVVSNYAENEKLREILLENNELIKFLYINEDIDIDTKELLNLLNDCKLNLTKFFEKLKLKLFFENAGFYVSDSFLYKNEDKIIPMDSEITTDIMKQLDLKKLISPQYFKSTLSSLLALETYQTNSNTTMYNMAFVYLFTIFDELLLKTIRIICMYEKKWLISNSNLTAAEILKCDTTDKIHELLVEKKVNELSRGSYKDKLDFLVNRGIVIDDKNKKLFEETILYLSLKRNIIVHNEGVWNISTRDLLKNTQYYETVSIGKPINRSIESFEQACINFENAAKYLYYQICDKFNLLFKYVFSSEKEIQKH